MAVQIQVRRGTAAEWTAANPVLADGELALERDTKRWKIGDGVTAWNDLVFAAATYGDYLFADDHDRAMHDALGFVHDDEHTKATHDALGINAAALGGSLPSAYAKYDAGRLVASSFESNLANNAIAPTAPGGDYPRGFSAFPVTQAAGWPSDGVVQTMMEEYSSGMITQYRGSQTFTGHAGDIVLVRGWYESAAEWSPWRPTTDLGWDHIGTIDGAGLATNFIGNLRWSGIPSKYTRFKIVAPEFTFDSTGNSNLYLRLNDDAAGNYSYKSFYSTSSTDTVVTGSTQTFAMLSFSYLYGGATRTNMLEAEIWNNGRQSFIRSDHQCQVGLTTSPYTSRSYSNWNSAASIHMIDVYTSLASTWSAGAIFHLYGMVE